jgi:membrane associated rhomboid family serine protease
MLICGGATFYNCQKINDQNMMSRSLVEAHRKVASAKKFESNWLMFGIPAVVVWLCWFFYELYLMNNEAIAQGLFVGGCVGALIGAICGIRIHLKTQRQYQDIIDQIEDLTAEQ